MFFFFFFFTHFQRRRGGWWKYKCFGLCGRHPTREASCKSYIKYSHRIFYIKVIHVLNIFHIFLCIFLDLCHTDFFFLKFSRSTITSNEPEGSRGKTGPLLVTNPFTPLVFYLVYYSFSEHIFINFGRYILKANKIYIAPC